MINTVSRLLVGPHAGMVCDARDRIKVLYNSGNEALSRLRLEMGNLLEKAEWPWSYPLSTALRGVLIAMKGGENQFDWN